jgi:hypothetical protein
MNNRSHYGQFTQTTDLVIAGQELTLVILLCWLTYDLALVHHKCLDC